MSTTETATTLEALLADACRLDPERFRVLRGVGLQVKLGDRWHKATTFMGEPDAPRIQAATQEAIERRGWLWGKSPYENGVYIVLVRVDGLPVIGWTSYEAAALLSAYLQALEAQQ